MTRPETLAEVVERTLAGEDFAPCLSEFLDEFYLDHGDRAAQQVRIDATPAFTGDALTDAWVGASGEHLAQRWGLRIPEWTRRPEHNALTAPAFVPDSPRLRMHLAAVTPPAFGKREIYTDMEPLQRARWPKNEARAAPPGP